MAGAVLVETALKRIKSAIQYMHLLYSISLHNAACEHLAESLSTGKGWPAGRGYLAPREGSACSRMSARTPGSVLLQVSGRVPDMTKGGETVNRLITRPRSLLLVAVLATVATMCTVRTAHAASSASDTPVRPRRRSLARRQSPRRPSSSPGRTTPLTSPGRDQPRRRGVGGHPRGHGQLLHLERAVTGHTVRVLDRLENLWHAGRPHRLRQHTVRMGRPGLRDHSKLRMGRLARIVISSALKLTMSVTERYHLSDNPLRHKTEPNISADTRLQYVLPYSWP